LRARIAIGFVLAVAGFVAGCEDDRGYVEVKTNYVIRPGDVYWVGELQVAPAPSGQIDAVIGAPVGSLDIYIRRGAAKITVCDVTVAKNRIVTVTIDRGATGGICNVVA